MKVELSIINNTIRSKRNSGKRHAIIDIEPFVIKRTALP